MAKPTMNRACLKLALFVLCLQSAMCAYGAAPKKSDVPPDSAGFDFRAALALGPVTVTIVSGVAWRLDDHDNDDDEDDEFVLFVSGSTIEEASTLLLEPESVVLIGGIRVIVGPKFTWITL